MVFHLQPPAGITGPKVISVQCNKFYSLNTEIIFLALRIYLYDVLKLDRGPMKIFSGSKIGSFFVKARKSAHTFQKDVLILKQCCSLY